MKLNPEITIDDLTDFKSANDSTSSADKKAVITHYLHNSKNGVSKYYEEDALNYLDEFHKQLKNEGIKITKAGLKKNLSAESRRIPFPEKKSYKFKFIDLFAGVGGFRMAMQNLGGKCVFSSEWDKNSQITYKENFGEFPFGDITREKNKQRIPDDFDILCAGFPCQAFSIAGRRGGFEDTRGTLFFDVADILKRKNPKAFFLENVKGLFNHQGGRTLGRIIDILRDELDYEVPDPQIVNARDFGVPQNRERVFIVGFRKDLKITNFEYPRPTGKEVKFADVKEKEPVSVKYFMSTQYLDTLRKHRERHATKGNGFGYEIIEDSQIANAIVVGGMGRERNLVRDFNLEDFTPETKIKGEVNREGIRRMTPREWARLQGFPDEFIIPVADVHAYKQFGNSVAVPAVQATAENIVKLLNFKSAKRKS